MVNVIPGFVPDVNTPASFVAPYKNGLGFRLYGATSGHLGFIPPNTITSVDFTLPAGDGTPGQVWQTNGAGVISWASVTVPTSANPSASIGLNQINGATGHFMDAGSAPALSQSITPTWTGLHIHALTDTSGANTIGYGWKLTNTLNQLSNAGFTDLLINRTESAPGSGSQRFIDMQVGGTSKASFDHLGNLAINTTSYSQAMPGIEIRTSNAGGSAQWSLYDTSANFGLFGILNGSGGYCLIQANNSPLKILTGFGTGLQLDANGFLTIDSGIKDATNIVLGTTTGTKLGTAATQKLGLFGAVPIVQPTVTGSRGGNTALASLLTQLATLGAIVDGSSA